MTNSNDDQSPQGERTPDGISCAGFLLLIVLVLSALGVGLRSTAISANNHNVGQVAISATPSGKANDPVLARITETSQPNVTQDFSPDVTPTPAQNGSPLATPDAKPTQLTISQEAEEPIKDLPVDEIPVSRPETMTQPPISRPLPTPIESTSHTLKVPILMYHYISEPPEDADKYRLDLSVPPGRFREQMHFLVENGYEVVDLYDLSLAVLDLYELPDRPVVITLDDGYRDNYENAYPILQELGLKATFFITTDFIDQGNPNYMNWQMIEEMSSNGMRFEPHSKTHPDLTDQERDFVIWEVLGSAETVEAHIGFRPRYFAYPGGRFDDEVKEIVADLDFWGAVTTYSGDWHSFEDRYEWTRLRIRNTTALKEFATMVE